MNIDEFVARNAQEFYDWHRGLVPLPIYLDMDKTLCYETCFTEKECLNATPVDRMIRRVIHWQGQGHDITIFTARNKNLFLATRYWLEQQSIYISRSKIEPKPLGIFIDDRSFNPTIDNEKLIKLPDFHQELKNVTSKITR